MGSLRAEVHYRLQQYSRGAMWANLAEVELGISSLPAGFGSHVKGTVVTAFNNPVASGFVNVYIDGFELPRPVTNGKFNLQLTRCYTGMPKRR